MKKNNSNTQLFTISEYEVGKRIDNFLFTKFKRVPKSMLYRILRTGKVRVNKKKIQPKYKLKNKDEVYTPLLYQNNIIHYSISTKLTKIAILNKAIIYEDDYLLALNKPTNFAVHGGSGINFGIIEGLRVLRPYARFLELVHRLDKDTSGVLLIAKKRTTLCALHEQLRSKNIQKNYLALVHGQWQSDNKIIITPLVKNVLAQNERIVKVGHLGKMSETHFQIKERFSCATLMIVKPITGRTHQIRVHAKYVGHPIVCDERYGDSISDQQLKNCGIQRIFLQAESLCFQHPNSGKFLRIEAPLDDPLRLCLTYLRKYHKYDIV